MTDKNVNPVCSLCGQELNIPGYYTGHILLGDLYCDNCFSRMEQQDHEEYNTYNGIREDMIG